MSDETEPSDRIQALAELMVRAKAAVKLAEETLENTHKLLQQCMAEERLKTLVVDMDGHPVEVRLVKQSVTTFDVERMEKELDPNIWARLTKRVFDRSTIERILREGLVDVSELGMYMEVKPRDYVRIREIKETPAE